MMQTSRLVHLTVAIQKLGLTKQNLNVTIVKRWVIMLGIVGIQLEGLKKMSILL